MYKCQDCGQYHMGADPGSVGAPIRPASAQVEPTWDSPIIPGSRVSFGVLWSRAIWERLSMLASISSRGNMGTAITITPPRQGDIEQSLKRTWSGPYALVRWLDPQWTDYKFSDTTQGKALQALGFEIGKVAEHFHWVSDGQLLMR